MKITKKIKALAAWNSLCQAQFDGGLNLTNMITWNKATINKLLWNLCTIKYALGSKQASLVFKEKKGDM